MKNNEQTFHGFWLTEGQSKEKDREILRGYTRIISYFIQNPEKAIISEERKILRALYEHDVVLRSDEALHKNLWRVLLRSGEIDAKLIHVAKGLYKPKN